MIINLTPEEKKSQTHNPMNNYDRRIISNLKAFELYLQSQKSQTMLEENNKIELKKKIAESITLLAISRYQGGEQKGLFENAQALKSEVDAEQYSFSKNFNGSAHSTTLK